MGGKLQHLMEKLHLGKGGGGAARDVPRGHFAVYVGEARARFVVPTAYLKHPAFVALLKSVEEEYGFDHCFGGLTIPCSERDFAALLGRLSSSPPSSSSWR
ncbi:hypothetical protein E2562_026154 [Oryza meyeriana var. granulata]|uniref:Uncharacterized protein n=1 Tax=Oryza meyeriana var. granulata TaxID=110450 RepID=A0A6G1E4A8_9ORYZ|nr:hypothetical protein E2562_026154 [Oryza meyeriana var. granulata]